MHGALYLAVAYSPPGQIGVGSAIVYLWDEEKKSFRTVQVMYVCVCVMYVYIHTDVP
jgi:hypothetical protein